MQVFLDRFAAALPQGIHAALLLDSAGWHTAGEIIVPANVSLVFLPPYSPKLNPAERLWLHLRDRYLSLRLFRDLDDIIDGCCDAWNRMTAEPGRVASLNDFPYLQSVRISEMGMTGDPPFRRADLRLFISHVLVSDNEIRISGPTTALIGAAMSNGSENPREFGSQFNPKWRPLRDSNPCRRRERAVS